MSRSLENYIRTLRKRAGLSQEELAFLLGGIEDATVSRHEAFERQPRLRTALLYSAILGVDPRELFAGLYEDEQQEARKRAGELLKTLEGQLPTRTLERKLELLHGLSDSLEPRYVPETPDETPRCKER